MKKDDRKFDIDYSRLKEICLLAYSALQEGKGVFRKRNRLLPQWALPEDMEHNPRREETKLSDQAGNYLFVLATMEKRAQSRENIKNGLKTWANPETRWIFNPLEVVVRDKEDAKRIVKENLRYVMHDFPGMFLSNNSKIVNEYGGLARNIINGQTIEEARRRLMEFRGIGTGIANLFIIYCTERKIAEVLDIEKAMLKVDIHKTKIPVNTEAVTPTNGRIRRDNLTPMLEEKYLQICREENLSPKILDGALWIIGSEICAQKDFGLCAKHCPLETVCTSLVTEDVIKGEIVAYENGQRVEMRKRHKKQLFLDIDI